jgi:hypothetical protein
MYDTSIDSKNQLTIELNVITCVSYSLRHINRTADLHVYRMEGKTEKLRI